MAAYVDQAYYGWPHEEVTHQDESQEVSAPQILDHGSISFGRFTYESLSWERRSVFVVDKRQEELERFKSPGLVAKKKAYFEQYYKKLRAMKALQESQHQTEMNLEYGGDGSISSQTGEEEDTTVQVPTVGDAVADALPAPVGETPAEAPTQQDRDVNTSFEVQIDRSDPESEIPEPDSSCKKFEQEEEYKKVFEVCVSSQEPVMIRSAHIQDDKVTYHHDEQHFDMDASTCESLFVSIEETKQQNDLNGKEALLETNISGKKIEPEVSCAETSYQTSCKVGEGKPQPADSLARRKVIPGDKKYKNSITAAQPKEPSGPRRNVMKLEDKAMSKSQNPSQGLKYSTQITTSKSRNGVGSSKTTAESRNDSRSSKIIAKVGKDVGSRKTADNKVSGKDNYISVTSQKPLREVHSNVTVPRPFSLATDRRAAVPSSNRESKLNLISRSPDQASKVNRKNTMNLEGSTKKTVTYSSMKSRGQENQRGHEEKRRPRTTHGSQSTTLKDRGARATGQVKQRSLNLPPNNKLSSYGSTSMKIKDGIRIGTGDEGKRGVSDNGLRAVGSVFPSSAAKHRSTTNCCAPPSAKGRTDRSPSTAPAAKLRTETKRMATPREGNSVVPSGRKPRFGDQSLDGKKPRHEKPRWR